MAYRRRLDYTQKDHENASEILKDLVIPPLSRFEPTGEVENDDEAISTQQKVFSLTPAGELEMLSRLSNLGDAVLGHTPYGGSYKDVEDALSRHQKAVQHIPEDHGLRLELLDNLGNSFLKRFEQAGNVEDIEEALRLHYLAARSTPQSHADMPTRLNNVAGSLNACFHHSGDLEDIHQSILAQRRAIALAQEGGEYMSLWMDNLGKRLLCRFEYTGDLRDVLEAVQVQRKAVELTPSDRPLISKHLSNLGLSLLTLFRHTGGVAYLQEAISVQKTAVEVTAEPHTSTFAGRLDNLGNSLLSRFEYFGNIADVNEAIALHRRAVDLVPDEQHLPKSQFLSSLGNSLLRLFQRSGNLSDIDEAIHAHQEAVERLPKHAGFSHALSDLGIAFMSRFQHTGGISDIEQAIDLQREAVDLLPEHHVDLPACLNSLAKSFRSRFERNGVMSDIDDAISSNQKAVNLCPENHADLSIWLSNLGICFRTRFELTGNMVDINQAIHAHQKSVLLTPVDHAGMAGRMNSLGSSYACRFEFSLYHADIDEAVLAHREAVRLTSEDHSELPRRLSNAGNSFLRRFEFSDKIIDMEEAVKLHRKAVHLTPQDHSDFPGILNNLAICLVRVFESSGNLSYVDEAIQTYNRCIALLDEGHPDLSIWLQNLGDAFRKRFEESGDLTDIDQAMKAQRKGIDITPALHASMPDWTAALGYSFLSRYETTFKVIDLKAAIAQFRVAAEFTTGRPSSRLVYARKWASLSSLVDPFQTLIGFTIALDILPQVVSLGRTLASRNALLSVIDDLPNEAAAHAIEQGRLDLALEWLEQGRCVLWKRLNGLRTPFDDVHDINPTLADELRRVSEALERAGTRSNDTNNPSAKLNIVQKIRLEEEAREHTRLSEEWDALLGKVRNIRGFENFLRPVRFSQLSETAPEEGPVVVININARHCDALILFHGATNVKHIPLHSFSFKEAERLQKSLAKLLSHARLRSSKTRAGKLAPALPQVGLKDILVDLWVSVGKPILNGLGYSISCDPPRIWWCATGPLSFLPIHAAGVYTSSTSGNRVSDYVVSSYTPALSAVSNKSPERVKKMAFSGILGISQPNTPGKLTIPNTTKEVRQVQSRFVASQLPVSILEGPEATVQNVLKKMETHSWIHLACHAVQNIMDPTKSAFYLEDGPLELSTIIAKRIPCADFAFLSACETGMGDEKLSEEVVHLAAGMLSAGYHGVIATMWSIPDEYAPIIAQDVYSNLLDKKELDSSFVAQSLHFATKSLQESLGLSESSLFSWVPFIHLGF